MLTCTWAPTVFQGTQVVDHTPPGVMPAGQDLHAATVGFAQTIEALGISHMLVAQRWWGSGAEIEASSLDCLAMTAYFAAQTSTLKLVTAIHPGFFQPTAIAKWGATLDRISGGRWAINVTSGWNLVEFDMYGIDALTHDERYARSAEFIEVIRGAWPGEPFSYEGRFYRADNLLLEPKPTKALEVYQGGQSPAAVDMASQHSDWMFLNGGEPAKIVRIIEQVRAACRMTGRQVRFALYAAPLCRETDEAAWAEIDARLGRVDHKLVAKRRERVDGAEGMWANDDDPLSALDTNEGYSSRLIGSPATVLKKIEEFQSLGVDMLHVDIRDALFQAEVLPTVIDL